jgi:hypothetical protein
LRIIGKIARSTALTARLFLVCHDMPLRPRDSLWNLSYAPSRCASDCRIPRNGHASVSPRS